MPLLGFTTMRDQILSGEKRQTIRLPRKHPIKVGDKLYLYWKLRTKHCEFLSTVYCTSCFIKKWGDMKNDLALARLDGFKSLQEFRDWFVRYNPSDLTEFTVIQWR